MSSESSRTQTPDLSIVTTMYHSQGYLKDFLARTTAAAQRLTPNFEIIFVNDGSPDDSLDVAKGFLSSGSKISVVDLSRNFGHHRAMMAGIAFAKGKRVFLIDADLEEDPALLLDFAQKMEADSSIDVVFGVCKQRVGSPFKKISGSLFYKLFNLISDVSLPENLCVVRLMSRRYVEGLMQFRETEFIIGGLWQLAGFKQLAVPIDRGFKGLTTYSLRRQLSLLLNAVVSFSVRPLHFIFWIGLGISALSAGYICWALFIKFWYGLGQTGFTTLAVSAWFLGGLNLFSLGIVGLYLAMIYKEVKKRPLVVVREVHEN